MRFSLLSIEFQWVNTLDMNDSEEFKPSLKQINEDIRPTWEDIKKQSEVLVNKLGCPRSFVGGMLHAIASDFSDMKTWE